MSAKWLADFDVKLVHAFDVHMNFHKRVVYGPVSGGARQGYVSLKDGIVKGPKLNGKLMEYSGADWGTLRADGVLEANAHYMIEADDGSPIYIHNRGYIYNTMPNAPGPAYFRCTPYFKAPVGKHDWLNRTVIVGGGQRHENPDYTIFRYYSVELDPEVAKRFDYIIVGGGSAGCVIAARLTEDPSIKVLLLEAGDDERKFFRIAMPLAWRDAFLDPRTSWGFETEPEQFADGRRVPAPRGKVLGGSNSVNGLMYMRGCPADYNDWARRGLPGWDYDGVLPYFRRSESNWRGVSRFHGGTGPLTTARHETDDFIYPRIIETAEALGFKHLEDFHAEDIEGFTVPDLNYHGGERGSTVARFLRPAMSRGNLSVRINTLVHSLLLENGRCVGVRAESGGNLQDLRCEREVILSAGTFNSPQLLQLSGIGAPADLEPHGIAVRHALPGVGENLQDHQSAGMEFAASGEFCFDSRLRYDRLALSVLQWKMFRNGIIARAPISAQGLVRTSPELDRPDLQMLVSPVSMFARSWFPGWRKGVGHVLSLANVLLHPRSRGKVSLRSADPRAKPKIQLNLLQAEADREGLRNIIKFVRRFFATAPSSELVSAELKPGPAVQSDAEIDAWIRATVRTAMHPTSTCAMGVDGMSVVDGQLRVHGLSGLRIADASIMPDIVGGNTNAPTIMIAEKAADLIRGTGV